MGIEVQQSPDSPHRYDCRATCDGCRAVQQVSTIFADTLREGLAEPDVVQREIRRRLQHEGWLWQDGGPVRGSLIRQVVTISCRACQGAALPSPLPVHLRELLRRNLPTLVHTLIEPARNVIATLARNQHAPAAEELYSLMGQAISRSHPDDPQELRAAFNELGVLIHAQRNAGGPSWAPASPLARLGDLTLPWRGSQPATFQTDGVQPGDIIVGNPGTPEEFRTEYMGQFPDPPEESSEEFVERRWLQTEPENPNRGDVYYDTERRELRMYTQRGWSRIGRGPAAVDQVLADSAVSRDRVYVVGDGPNAGAIVAHPDRVETIRELVENTSDDPDHTPLFDPADVEAARDQMPVSVPARSIIAIHTDPAVTRGQTYLMNQGGGYVVMAHPEDADEIREVVQQREADPDMQVFTSRPLEGFRRIPVARGQRAEVREGTVTDQQGNRHTVGPFEVDLPDTPGPHRVGLDIASGEDTTIASILVNGKVIGQTPIKRSTFMTEKLPPKSSWERLMEDDDDECR